MPLHPAHQPTSPRPRPMQPGFGAFASALIFALGKHEVGKGRVRHTRRGKFRPREFGEDWRPENPEKAPAGSPLPAPRTALTALARSPAPPSLGAECPAAAACPRGRARPGDRVPARQRRRTRGRQSRAPALQRPQRRAWSPGQLCQARGWGWRGGPVPPAGPVRLLVPTGELPPPARLGSDPGGRQPCCPGRPAAEARIGT